MKFNKNISKLILGFSFFTITSTGCEKYLEVPLPIDQLATESVFATRSGIDAAVTGMYSAFASGVIKANFYKFTSFISDEGEINPLPGNDVGALLAANIAATNQNLPSLLWFYLGIYRANDVLSNLVNVPTTILPDSVKRRYLAAAKYVRAAEHFSLVTTWGDVPLTLTTSADINVNNVRTPSDQVFAAIIKDLEEAAADLPATVNATSFGALTVHNKYQPLALLARVYLYLGRWAEAEAAANEVISSGRYLLVDGVNNVFKRGSREAITSHGVTSPGTLFENRATLGWLLLPLSSGNATTNYPAMSASLLAAFEADDQRRVNGNWTTLQFSRVFPNKYLYNLFVPATTIAAAPQDFIYQRLAEVILIRSEARAKQNNVSGAAADLNLIRTRAGLANTAAATQPELLAAIEKERFCELYFEGFRWYDLKRTGRLNEVLGAVSYKKDNYQEHYNVMPIGQADIVASPLLQQNPGY